jgi:hypothetical protein
MAATTAGSLISRPSWEWRPAIGNALAEEAVVEEHYSARRTLVAWFCVFAFAFALLLICKPRV